LATGTLRLGKDAVTPLMGPLFSALFPVLQNEDLPENDYVMKCVMRILSIVGSDVAPVMEDVLEQLTATLERVCRNPSNPQFNHYIFECIALLVRSACSPTVTATAARGGEAFEKFEALLFPPFQSILQLDVVEFVPYVFQVLGQLLSYRPSGGGLSAAYSDLFPPLLSPVLWVRRGNVPALTDLVLAYIYQGMEEIVQKSLLEGLLGVFQKVLASKATEVQAFKLINAIVRKCPCDVMDQYMPMVVQLLLMRLQEHNTEQYCRLFVHFLCITAMTGHGPSYVFNALESVQAGMNSMVITQIWQTNTEFFSRADAADVAQILSGGSLLLCQTPVADDEALWGALVKSLLGLAKSSPSITGDKGGDVLYDEEAEAREFDSTYSKLAYAQIVEGSTASDKEATDFPAAQLKFLQELAALCEKRPGVYSQALQSILDDADKTFLGELLSEAGITLA
jgi:exportin-2 (importin alpha re-exporter)